jgi:DNA-binding NtrC family response regulator
VRVTRLLRDEPGRGSSRAPSRIRVLASTDRELAAAVDDGSFNLELFELFKVITVRLKPLRERREDIPRLAKTFLARRKRGIDVEATRMLLDHEWPGNVRELRNVIDRAALIEESDVITPSSLPPLTGDVVQTAARRQWTLDELESRYIREVLRQTRSNFSTAAKILGINRKTLLEKRRRYGIE